MTISYITTTGAGNTVIPVQRVHMLSAFEANTATDKDGNSLFRSIATTSKDEPLIKHYCAQAARTVEALITPALTTQAEYTETSVTFTFKQSYTQRNQSSLPNAIADALTTFALARWLSDKQPERTAEYDKIFQQHLANIRTITFERPKPTLPTT